MNDFYVYAYLREDLYSPYYIGKGTKARIDKQQGRWVTVPPKSRRVKVAENLTEQDALELEAKMILMWGRKCDGGVLLNKSEGGDAGVTGLTWKCAPRTPDHAQKLSKALKGRDPWNKGKTGTQTHTDAAKAKCSAAASEHWKNNTHPLSKRVMYDGVIYESASELARAVGKGRSTIGDWIKKGKCVTL